MQIWRPINHTKIWKNLIEFTHLVWCRLSELWQSVAVLFKNPTFLLITLAGALDAALVLGVSTFGPKYLQSAFSITPALSALYFGESRLLSSAPRLIALLQPLIHLLFFNLLWISSCRNYSATIVDWKLLLLDTCISTTYDCDKTMDSSEKTPPSNGARQALQSREYKDKTSSWWRVIVSDWSLLSNVLLCAPKIRFSEKFSSLT